MATIPSATPDATTDQRLPGPTAPSKQQLAVSPVTTADALTPPAKAVDVATQGEEPVLAPARAPVTPVDPLPVAASPLDEPLPRLLSKDQVRSVYGRMVNPNTGDEFSTLFRTDFVYDSWVESQIAAGKMELLPATKGQPKE